MSPSQLAAALGLSSGGMTKAITRLEAAGLVKRIPDPSDGRGVLVELTSRGKQLAFVAFT